MQNKSFVLGRRHRLLHVRSCDMIRKRTGSIPSHFLTFSLFRTFTSGKVDPTVTATGRKKGITSTSSRSAQEELQEKRILEHSRLFIRAARFRITMIELGPTEEVIREMDKLANEDHAHHATLEEISVYRNNWWIEFCWF